VQAVVFTDQARIVLAERPEPVAGDGEVLIEVGAVGICGTDLHAPAKPAIFTPGVVLGHEFAAALRLLARGVIATAPLTTAVLPLADHEKAFASLRDPDRAVKVFLDPAL
jgi:threonine dehydrogenase-like Zn-dependent dehydrogenase